MTLHTDAPALRFQNYGAEALSTADLLSILIRTGTAERTPLGTAEALLAKFGNLRGLANATLEELQEVSGIGKVKAVEIKTAIELGRRLVAASPEERVKVRAPRDVYNLLGPSLRDEKREHFVALLLDSRNGVIRSKTISIGDLDSSIVNPREVFAEAIRHGAASLIVAHNHPSGDPSPSVEDIACTRRLDQAGELLGIELLDHIVLGDGVWSSLKELGKF